MNIRNKIGGSIEEYNVGEKIGQGGFATVYRARCRNTDQIVAIKMISKRMKRFKEMITKIEQEVAIHSKLNHPAIIQLFTSFQDDDYVYLVLELCPQGELKQYIEKQNGILSEDKAREYLRQIVSGMLYLHSKGIMHRDLKLSNLLLDDEGRVKIADFGLATQLEHPNERHMTVCGTPNFMSPEILMGRPHGLAADVWCLGCMLYIMLVGYHSYEKERIRVNGADYDKIPSHLSSSAKDLIVNCLQKEPEQRIKLGAVLKHPFMVTGLKGYNSKISDSGLYTMTTVTTMSRAHPPSPPVKLPRHLPSTRTGVIDNLKNKFTPLPPLKRGGDFAFSHATSSSFSKRERDISEERRKQQLMPRPRLGSSGSYSDRSDSSHSSSQMSDNTHSHNSRNMQVIGRDSSRRMASKACQLQGQSAGRPGHHFDRKNQFSNPDSNHRFKRSSSWHKEQHYIEHNEERNFSSSKRYSSRGSHSADRISTQNTFDRSKEIKLPQTLRDEGESSGQWMRRMHERCEGESGETSDHRLRGRSRERHGDNEREGNRRSSSARRYNERTTSSEERYRNRERSEERYRGSERSRERYRDRDGSKDRYKDRSRDNSEENCQDRIHSCCQELQHRSWCRRKVQHTEVKADMFYDKQTNHHEVDVNRCEEGIRSGHYHHTTNDKGKRNISGTGYRTSSTSYNKELCNNKVIGSVPPMKIIPSPSKAKREILDVQINISQPHTRSSAQPPEKRYRPLKEQVSPLTTTRLKATHYKHKSAWCGHILTNGEVCLEFVSNKRGQEVTVCRISPDGLRIVLYQRKGSLDSQPGNVPPPMPKEEESPFMYSFESLPSEHHAKYKYAARFIEMVKTRTPKITYYTDQATCSLMENSPDPVFKAEFYCGVEMLSSRDIRKPLLDRFPELSEPGNQILCITDNSGVKKTIPLSSCPDALQDTIQPLFLHFKEIRDHCLYLEEVHTNISEKTGMDSFPIKLGLKPASPLSTPPGSARDRAVPQSNKENVSPSSQQSYRSPRNIISQIGSFEMSEMSIQPTFRQRSPLTERNIQSGITGASKLLSSPKYVKDVGWVSRMNSGEIMVEDSDGHKVLASSTEVRFIDPTGKSVTLSKNAKIPKSQQDWLSRIQRFLTSMDQPFKSVNAVTSSHQAVGIG